jgi:cardiolipin synthase
VRKTGVNVPLWLPWTNLGVVGLAFLIVDMVIRIAALGVVPHNRRPSAAWGWLVMIFFLPTAGAAAFLLIGNSRLGRDRSRKQKSIRHYLPDTPAAPVPAPAKPEWASTAVSLVQADGGLPLTEGNKADVFTGYTHALASIIDAIGSARSFVHFQFYIVALDKTTEPVFAALEEARARGVAVRVLLDHLGSAGFPGYKQAVRRLDAAGIQWRRMLPVRPWRGQYQRPDLRNHRKILVVDGITAFTGSQNIIDASYNKSSNRRRGLQWRDLVLRLEGPAVQHLNAVFIADWYSETNILLANEKPVRSSCAGAGAAAGIPDLSCQVLPSGPGMDNENNLRLFTHLLYNARERIVICTPYFVPDESMLTAITSAVQRGVEVRVHAGATSDHVLTHHAQRSYYERLLAAGVDIHLYEQPYVLHAKFLLIDDATAVVTSSNMDIRSFALNQEVSLLIFGSPFLQLMNTVEEQYTANSRGLDLAAWRQRPLYQKYFDNLCRLTAGLQ